MIWLTWRQHRKEVLYTLIALAALAAILVPTGLTMHGRFEDTGLKACMDGLGTASLIPQTESAAECQRLANEFQQKYSSLAFVAVLFVILPVFVGVFFGAPLVARELEQGTHRFVWTQGVSRTRWALAKLGLIGGFALLVAVVYALGVSWWFTPLVAAVGSRMEYLAFDVQGVVPVAYTLFALALGVFTGTYWRRVLPAMGVALAGFTVVRGGIELLARPRYLAPKELTYSLLSTDQPNSASGDWIQSHGVRDGSGELIMPDARMGPCPAESACGQEIQSLGPGAHQWQLYQPGDRFWLFQGIETGIFLALTALLIVLALRRLRTLA
ncbi:ABC transporter permease [Actinocorallia populi]|uniref:ABC transporter permease n=1 Tax=Actinocorallia populi TaxID=2079200 RepID=UPI000D090F44|nr:ABC transporter permease subunit [Actinocorallia populi]